MKTRLIQILNVLLLLFPFLPFGAINAQTKSASGDPYPVNYIISNVRQVSDRVLEFDFYIKDTGTDKPFELSIVQGGIFVNSEIINGGNVTAMVVPGFSELNPSQQPTTSLFVKGPGTSIIKIAAKIAPGPGAGTIIKTTDKGTRICRLRITNSVPFAKARPNLTFCFTQVPYPTKVFHYIGRTSTKVAPNAGNGSGDEVNAVLNE